MTTETIFENFKSKRILVIGDVMIDSYLRGDVSRISPEAPVPIVNLSKSEDRLGGAANVAINLKALGAEPILCSIIGEDFSGKKYLELMSQLGLSTSGIIPSNQRITTKKTRVIGNNQHLLRIDEERVENISVQEEDLLFKRILSLITEGVDAVILEDYNKGVLTEKLIRKTIEICNQNNIIVTVDPKKDNFLAYENVTLFKPNLKELKEGINVNFDISINKADFEKAIDLLEEKLNNKISFVTLSEHGVFVKSQQNMNYLPAHIRNIADVSGAGDTVISVATLCLAVGLSPKLMAEYANLAGGLVCEMSGVVPIDAETLKNEIDKLV